MEGEKWISKNTQRWEDSKAQVSVDNGFETWEDFVNAWGIDAASRVAATRMAEISVNEAVKKDRTGMDEISSTWPIGERFVLMSDIEALPLPFPEL